MSRARLQLSGDSKGSTSLHDTANNAIMSNDLIKRLQRLVRGFSAPTASLADAHALFDDAEAFRKDALTHPLPDPAEVSSVLAALSQHFGTLNRALLNASEPNKAPGAQFFAACVALRGCAHLASRLPLRHNDLFRLASSLALVFGAGMAMLRQHGSNAADALAQPVSLLMQCSHQLAAAHAVLQQAADPRCQPEAAAAFVRTVGRPDAVLPWLLAVSQTLLAVPEDLKGARLRQLLGSSGDPAHPAQDLNSLVLADYAGMARSLLAHLPEAYTTAMQQSPATQQAMLSVLLDRCLPVLAAGSSPGTLADVTDPVYGLALCLGGVLDSPCLKSELARRLQQPKAAAHIRQAVQVVIALPLRRREADTPDSFGGQHGGAAMLLARLCASAKLPARTAAAAAWQFAEAVPQLATLLATLAANDSIASNHLLVVCCSLQLAGEVLLSKLPDTISSDSQLAAWAAACDAAVRLVPLLLQLLGRFRSAPGKFAPHTPLQLSQQLLSLLGIAPACGKYVADKFDTARPPAADEQLVQQLWALHTSICRFVAWLAADPSNGGAAVLPGSEVQGVDLLLVEFSRVRYALLTLAGCSVKEGAFSQERVQGMCAAHIATLQTAVQMLGGASRCAAALPHIAADFHAICDTWEFTLTDASVTALFGDVIAQLAPNLAETPRVQWAVVDLLGSHPQLAVALARSGGLHSLLKEAHRLEHSSQRAAAAGMAAAVQNALFALDHGAREAVAGAADATAPQCPPVQQLQQAAGVSAGLGSIVTCGFEAALLARLPVLSSRLLAAAKLADLLHEWWQPAMQPERHAEAQLALAQAAANRSCAYLRCANLGGQGGPAAGEGAGSMRCSACRAVWYCGTACSHADWGEGGHRRVCKALGAARRAEKEERRRQQEGQEAQQAQQEG